jgi:hypothetical protein
MSGDLDMLVCPTTVDLTHKYRRNEWAPNDLRAESPVCAETHEMYRYVIESNIEIGQIMDVPVQHMQIVGHNTARCDPENIAYAVGYVLEVAERLGLELVPSNPMGTRAEAERVGLL